MKHTKPKKGEILHISQEAINKYNNKEPIDLFESEIIGEFVKGSGQYVILPKGTKILNGLYKLIDEDIRKPLGFEEVVLPKITPLESLEKGNILGKWDDYLLSIKPFSKTKGVVDEYVIDPLHCTVFYQFFEDKTIDEMIKWYDRSGPTYRNEDLDKLRPSIKQREFHTAEFIYMGGKEEVIKTRDDCLKGLQDLCNDLKMNYQIVVGDGCYHVDDTKCDEKEVLVKDLEMLIPNEKPLEVIGSCILKDDMTSKFNIENKYGGKLWSGCTGIGLNRMLYSIVSNHGPDEKYYPEKLREVMR